MSATINIVKITGESPGVETVVSGISLMSLDNANNSVLTRVQGPIDIPSSGMSYSYESWIKFRCSGAPSNLCDQFKVWGPSSQPGTGVTVYMKSAAAYETPSIPSSMTGWSRQDENYYSQETALTLSGNLSSVGDSTDYLVLCVQVAPGADIGSMEEIDFNYSWREQ